MARKKAEAVVDAAETKKVEPIVKEETVKTEPTDEEVKKAISGALESMMDKVKAAKTKPELKALAESYASTYNEAYQNGWYDLSVKIAEAIEEAVNKYTEVSQRECFTALKASADPMLEAVKTLQFDTIRTHDRKEGESKIPVREIMPSLKYIDLAKLHKFVDGGIGVEKDWVHKAEKANQLMTARVAVQLGNKPDEIWDSYYMTDIARKMKLGETPTSDTQILKLLTTVVQAMIGTAYKPLSKDVKYLCFVYSKKGKAALSVSCAKHNQFRQYLMEICNRIVCDKVYTVDYKIVKKGA